LRGGIDKKLRRHPEVLAAKRRASKDRSQATHLAVLVASFETPRTMRGSSG